MAGLGFDNRFPRVINSRVHGVIDYIHAATNFAAAAFFWNRNKRASMAAITLGANVLTNALLTDYELGVFRAWSFRTHGILDYGVATTSAAFPAMLGFADEPEANFFHVQGAVETLTAGMTDYDDDSGAEKPPHRRLHRAA